MNNNSYVISIIPQLKDNYSYIISSNNNKSAIVVDPADAISILRFIKDNKLSLEAIILTHHHSDHTSGILGILDEINVPVYSPNKQIDGTTNLVTNKDKINFSFISFDIIATPGHTLDHIVYYSKLGKILFSGDTLFRLGCGRVFEGTYEQMFTSLKILKNLNDETEVYCGHEYTLNNFKFLQSIFTDMKELELIKEQILKQLKNSNFSIPFNLGQEKKVNPFLSTNSSYYQEYKQYKKFNDFEMFSYIRDLKNNY
tara:strand:+ start:69 stop:836 length:768 start_codon:yes stop_codon:yes gene_type:complete